MRLVAGLSLSLVIARRTNTGKEPSTGAHTTGTREEWRKARIELLEAEKELTRRGDELARKRRELPWVRVEQDYRFDGPDGETSLPDLFGCAGPSC